jgi:hypothetical protein
MKQPTHKEQMNYLKEHDPITYYEMTSDPCGAGDDSGIKIFEFLFFLGLIGVLLYFILWYK